MAVPSLSIPQNQREYFLEIARLTDSVAEALIELFEQATPTLSPLDLTSQLGAKLLPSGHVNQLVGVTHPAMEQATQTKGAMYEPTSAPRVAQTGCNAPLTSCGCG